MANPTLCPYKVIVHGKERWRIYLGRQDGKDRYLTFAIREDADAKVRELKPRRRKQGEEAAEVPADDVLRWHKINQELLLLGSSLAVVGERALLDLKKITRKGTLGEMRAAFFASEADDLENNSVGDIRRRSSRLCNFLGGDSKPATVATLQSVTAFLGSLGTSRQDRINYRRVSNRWLGWAARNGWLPSNPVPPAPKGKAKENTRSRGKAVTLAPTEVRDLLKSAIDSGDLQVVSHLAISLFGGLRPEEFRGRNKINKISRTVTTDWGDLEDGRIHVKEECSKVRMGRQFEAHPTLILWLDWIREQASPETFEGPIVSGYWTARWRKWRMKHAKELLGNMRGRGKGVADGTMVDRRNVLRHTFGSCRLAETKDVALVAMEMGNSPEIVLQYYYDYKSLGKIAAEFWALTPSEVIKHVPLLPPEPRRKR